MNDIKVGNKIQLTLFNGEKLEGFVEKIDDKAMALNSSGTIMNISLNFIGMHLLIEENVPKKEIITTQEDKTERPYVSDVGNKLTELPSKSTGFRVLGKIDLSKIEKEYPNHDSRENEKLKLRKANLSGKTFSNFEGLKELLDQELKDDDANIISANGRIFKYISYEEKKFGFISDIAGNSYYFNTKSVVDPELMPLLTNARYHDIPVVCIFTTDAIGSRAKSICLPKKVKDIWNLAVKSVENNEKKKALEICEMLLSAFPKYLRAIN